MPFFLSLSLSASLFVAYRSQDPNRLNGKTIRMNPADWTYTIYTMGHRNPFRMALHNGKILATETGWYAFEELNFLQENKNYGWPCFEAMIRTPEYVNFQVPVCAAMVEQGTNTPPAYSYAHPQVVASMVTSISAVGSYNNRIYVGDYTARK
jgi:glucose/arabinose dehydrogenase